MKNVKQPNQALKVAEKVARSNGHTDVSKKLPARPTPAPVRKSK